MSNNQPSNPEGSPASYASRGSTPVSGAAARNSNSPGPFARPPVRRLSQLEPVHIAALNQEYRSQIREAAKAENNPEVQKEHYEKARKIKILLEKYEIMVQEKLKKQQQQQQQQTGGGPAYDSSLKKEDPANFNSASYSKSVSPPPGPSISQQMAANPPRYQYSQTPAQPDSTQGSQYSQFRVQLESSPATQPATGSPYYKNNQGMQYQQLSSEPLTTQLQRYKQLEKEAQDQLTEVERTIRETANLDTDQRTKLRQQEQNLRTKRDQYKSMALTVTQQLQSSMVKQQKLQNQKQVQKAKPQDKGKVSKFAIKTDSVPSPSYNGFTPEPENQDSYQRFGATSTGASRQSSPSAASPPDYSYNQTKYPVAKSPPPASSTPTLPSNYNKTQYKHTPHALPKSHSFGGGKPVRIPGKVGRPSLSSTALNVKQQRMPPMPPLTPTSYSAASIPEQVYNKRKINELIKSLMSDDMEESIIEAEVEDLVGDLIEEFVDNIATFACRLAKHRKSEHVEAKDVQVHLERNWNIRVPGFPGDEVSIVRRTVPSKAHNSKVDLLNASKYGGVNRM